MRDAAPPAGGLTDADAAAIRADLAAVGLYAPGLGERLARYVLASEGESVLGEVEAGRRGPSLAFAAHGLAPASSPLYGLSVDRDGIVHGSGGVLEVGAAGGAPHIAKPAAPWMATVPLARAW